MASFPGGKFVLRVYKLYGLFPMLSSNKKQKVGGTCDQDYGLYICVGEC